MWLRFHYLSLFLELLQYWSKLFAFWLFQDRGVLPYSLGGGVPLGLRKSYPLLDQIFQLCDPLPDQKCSTILDFSLLWGNPVKRDPIAILVQFSMTTRPYTRPNGLKNIPSTRPNGLKTIPFTRQNCLKTIPSPAAHTRIWENPPPPASRMKVQNKLKLYTIIHSFICLFYISIHIWKYINAGEESPWNQWAFIEGNFS